MPDVSGNGHETEERTGEEASTEPSTGRNRFYDHWRGRIHEWVADHSQEAAADYLLLLPDLFALLIRLIREPCVPLGFKGRLLLAAVYVASPVDLLPEFVLGVAGLADDLLVVALAILSGINEIDQEVIRKHWSGKEDIIDLLTDISTKSDEFMNSDTAQTIKQFFDDWQSGKKGWRELISGVFSRKKKSSEEA